MCAGPDSLEPHPRWLAGALKALSHCPRLEGSRPEPVQKNVGLGLIHIKPQEEMKQSQNLEVRLAGKIYDA